ncbi:MAG: ATP-binding protein [Spirochaetales bacterium]
MAAEVRTDSISRELLLAIYEHSPVGVGAFVNDQGLVALNPIMELLFGYTREEINAMGGPAALVEDPSQLTDVQEALAAVGAYHGRLHFRHKAGFSVWHEVKLRAIGEAEGVTGGSIAWHVDVSHEQELSVRLASQERHFAQVIDRIQDSVTIRNAHGVEYVNPAFEQVFGRPRAELYTRERAVLEWAVAEDRDKVRALYDAISTPGGRPASGQYRISMPDGSPRWIWTRVFPLSADGGYAVTFSTDMTDSVEASDLLRKKTREAEQASRAKSAFLANLSHEIRTPVAGILGLLELMEHEDAEMQETYRALMRDAASSLVRMLEDVLDLSRIESNQLSIIAAETDVEGAVGAAVAMLKPKAVERSIELTYAPDPSLPDLCLVDRVRLQQLVSNLVSNAVKYTEEGSVEVALRWEARGEGSVQALESRGTQAQQPAVLILNVRDTGNGMSEGQLELAFEPFRRLNESYTQKSEGTGLGLPLVKRLVELMKGDLDVRSTVGDGTSFTVTLPVAAIVPAPTGPPAEANEAENRERVVLLAEDNRIVQLTAQMQLSRGGHQVYLASNGIEAVEIVKRHRVDIVLMDMQMPVMNGLDATAQIRANEDPADRVPILALTAYSSREDQESFFAAGVNDILIKPCSAEKLHQAVSEYARG